MKITKISIAISALAFIVALVNLIYSIKAGTQIGTAITILCITVVVLIVDILLAIAATREDKREAAALAADESANAKETEKKD